MFDTESIVCCCSGFKFESYFFHIDDVHSMHVLFHVLLFWENIEKENERFQCYLLLEY